MPRIWADTIDSHRRQVHDAILDATADLIVENGPMSVAMSTIAERAGIGRATLYKYFPDVESILLAWHERDFAGHLSHLAGLAESPSLTLDDLIAFVRSNRDRHSRDRVTDVVGTIAHAVAGTGEGVPDTVERAVVDALSAVLDQLVRRNEVRTDLSADDLARWLFHAIHAPDALDSSAVVELVVGSLAPPRKRRSAAPRDGSGHRTR